MKSNILFQLIFLASLQLSLTAETTNDENPLQSASIATITSDDSQTMLKVLNSLLLDSSYYGQWIAPEGVTPPEFIKDTGFTKLGFCSGYWGGQSSTFNQELLLQFFDGNYIDQNSLEFFLPDAGNTPNINVTNSSIIYTNCTASVSQKDSAASKCPMDISIYFIDMRNNQPFDSSSPPDSEDLAIQISVDSPLCNFSFITTPLGSIDPLVASQLVPYMTLLYFSVFLQAFAYRVLYNKIKNQPLFVLNFCVGTILFLTTHDLYLFINHIYGSAFLGSAVARSLSEGIGLAYAIIIVFCDLPFLIQMTTKTAKLPWKDVAQKVSFIAKIVFPFNFLAFVFSFEAVTAELRTLFYFVFVLYLLPQIAQNFSLSRRYKWDNWLLIVISIPKILNFAYTEAYPLNIFRSTPNTNICFGFLGGFALQFLLLLIQTRWPRFGFKESEVYKISVARKDNPKNCPICLQDFNDCDPKNQLEVSLLSTTSNSEYTITTPCHHEFHLSCLKSWMNHKSDCPYCRQALPLTYQLDEYSEDQSFSQVL